MDWQDTLFDSSGVGTAQACKTSGGYLYFAQVSNINAADAFLQLFDLAAADVTVGTTTPKLSLLVPQGDGVSYGALEKTFDPSLHFNTAITYACTTTPTGAAAPATGLTVNLGFK